MVTIIIIIDNCYIALFSGVHKLSALYNILQHFLSFTNVIHIIMTVNNITHTHTHSRTHTHTHKVHVL